MEFLTKLEPIVNLITMLFHWSIIFGIFMNGVRKWKIGMGTELAGAFSMVIAILGCTAFQPVMKFILSVTKADIYAIEGINQVFSDISFFDIGSITQEYSSTIINSLALLLAFLVIKIVAFRTISKLNIMNKFTLTRLIDKFVGFLYGILLAVLMIWIFQVVLYLFVPSNYLRIIYRWYMEIPVNAYLKQINPFIL